MLTSAPAHLLCLACLCWSALGAEEIRLRDQGAWRTFEVVPARQNTDQSIILYEKGAKRTEYTRRQVTERLVVQLAENADVQGLANAFGLRAGQELSYAPRHFILHARSARESIAAAARLRQQDGVISADPLLARKLKSKRVPNDPLFPNQWHLLNTGQNGATVGTDVRVTNVWERFRGEGIVVGVVDDGVLYAHPDLASRVDLSISTDIRDGDSDPRPEGRPGADLFDEPLADSHGTAVAGLIAAEANNSRGISGVAPEATLAAIRVIGGNLADDQEGEALSQEGVDVSNNSWGAEDDGESLGGAGDLALQAIESGAKTGRNGKGTIYVFSAGNGGEFEDNANFDTYVNSIYTIAVGAVNDLGHRASYSERGSCLVVSAPGGNDAFRFQGITTTDLVADFGYNRPGAGTPLLPELPDRDYTQMFNGTSAAAPIVSGVAALMLQANPALGWRDVQEILLRTATKTSSADREWFTNVAGLKFNPDFGGGLVNADGAVELALAWSNLPAQTNIIVERNSLSQAVPSDGTEVEIPLECIDDLRLEHVTLHLDIEVASRGTLYVLLESPTGTISPLAEPRPDPKSDYSYTFMSVFHWAEPARGTWKIWLMDSGYFEPDAARPTVVRSARLTLYGTRPAQSLSPAILAVTPGNNLIRVKVSGETGRAYQLQRTRDFRTWQNVAQVTAPALQFELLDPNPPADSAFYRVARED